MKNKMSKIISKIIMAAIGLILILWPGTTLEAIVKIFGIALLVVGITGVLGYVISPFKKGLAKLWFAGAIIIILLSLIPVTRPDLIVAIFPLVVGIGIAITGIGNVIEAISIKSFSGAWIVPLLMSLLTVAAGCIIAFYPFRTMDLLVRIVGAVILYNAIVGLFMAFKYNPKVNPNGSIDITDINS